MKEKVQYRNALRSKKLIKEAFVELLSEKTADKITVTDVVNKADINRGTFYAHYMDTRDLLSQIENEFIDQLILFIGEIKYSSLALQITDILKKISDYFIENAQFLKKIMTSHGTELLSTKIKNYILYHLSNHAEVPLKIKTSDKYKIQINMFSNGVIGLYKDWFIGEVHTSLESITVEIALHCKVLHGYLSNQFK